MNLHKKLKWEKISNIFENTQEEFVKTLYELKMSEFDNLTHIARCHLFSQLRNEVINYIESEGIEVE